MNPVRSWQQEGEGKIRIALVAVIIICLLYLSRETLLAPLKFFGNRTDTVPRAITPRGDLASDEQSTIELFESVSPSVVYVTTIPVGYRRGFFGFEPLQIPEGTGSGFIWDDEGHIVTNYHVIASVDKVGGSCEVTLKDQSTWTATIKGKSPDYDLAVLKINAPEEKLKRISVGTSHNLQVGQKVFVIGNPFGFDQTLTSGIVGALHREITSLSNRKIQDVIQTDAAINPGNSGGPLLDSAGRLIGVTTAIRQGAQNIGFAVPVDTINRVVPEMIRHGQVERERSGLGILLLSEWRARWGGFHRGVVIVQVRKGSAAEKAGLRGMHQISPGYYEIGDIIFEIDGRPVNSEAEIREELDKHNVGDTVELTIEGEGIPAKVSVTLQALE